MTEDHCAYRAEAFHIGNPLGEKNTWRVVALTFVTMIAEIVAGNVFGSMALLADGWHMSTHVAALAITAVAYVLARRHARDPRFAFGTWKMEVLGGFAGGIVLGIVALFMAVESVARLIAPAAVRYDEALVVTVIGLAVNLLSATLLASRGHAHSHAHGLLDHDHAHDHAHPHDHRCAHAADGDPPPHRPAHDEDLNLRAAYAHVLADALTSVLAVVALLGGKYFGWTRLDPLTGVVGGAVVGVWAAGLIRETGRVLLDREMDHPVVGEIRDLLEADGITRVTDLHVWRVGYKQFAGIVSLKSARPKTADEYRADLSVHGELVHLTIEVSDAEALPAAANSPQVS